MGALAYALVFGVFLGLLSTDAVTPWIKIVGYVMTGWMFLAAIVLAIRITRDSE